MISRQNLWWSNCIVCGLSCLFLASEVRAEDGVEVLQRGPIHEAFVETITNEPQRGMVVDRKPPSPVNEIPPDVRPDGNRVRWIPGYWLLDEDRKDFVWVSGVWRNAPPGRRWVPGYWSPVENKFQWISGFWAAEESEAIEYLPEPPTSLEEGANRLAPSDDHFWVTGCWVWRGGGYAWRPGHWGQIAAGWTWVPSHYHYTPRGVVYVDGYWDYALAGRGYLFAPVYFGRPLYLQPNYFYRPNSLIDIGMLTASLFIQPRHRHYYYGDYFGTNYFDRGFYPWYSYGSNFRGYDPLFPYYRWHHQRQRNEVNWQRDLVRDYERRAKPFDARSPQFAGNKEKEAKQASRSLTRSLQDIGAEPNARPKIKGNREVDKRIEQMQRFRDERRKSELSKNTEPPSTKAKQENLATSEKRNDKSAKPDRQIPSKDAVERWRVPQVEKRDVKPQRDQKQNFSAPPAPKSKSQFDQPRSSGGKNQGAKPQKQGGGGGKGKGGKK